MKKLLALTTALLLGATLTACAGEDDAAAGGGTVLRIAYQDTGFPGLIEASGVLDGADFTVEWSNLTGPAANLQALYSGAVDLGHMGDTSLTIEQANAKKEWTEETVPLQIVAGWRNHYDPEFSPLVTVARADSGIESLEDAAGKKWGFNFGGYNHAQYLASLVEGGLREKDVEGTQFADGATSAAAFNSGEVDLFSGQHGNVLSSLQSGEATIIADDTDTAIPALNVWTARTDTLKDEQKTAALEDFFARLSGYWAWHEENPEKVKEVLKKQLKVDDARADFEYQVRSGAFRAFDEELIAEEQAVAQTLYDGKAIAQLPDVAIEYNPIFNEAQQAVGSAEFKARR